MLMMVESVKNKEWPSGLAYVLWEKLIKKFKPSDQVAKADQEIAKSEVEERWRLV